MSGTDIVERLRERRKIKYAADCKCGKCQLVHIDTVYEAADRIMTLEAASQADAILIARLRAEVKRLRNKVASLKGFLEEEAKDE